jgi:hypothetical protein
MTEKSIIHPALPSGFKTSVDVLKVVMGIPVSVIKNEHKKNKHTVNNNSSNCIDEKMLERFELLYRKNLKKYFQSSIENFDNLTGEERSIFIKFSKAFSKDGELTLSWRKIDKEAIRDNFFSQVKEETNTMPLVYGEDCIDYSPNSIESVISRSVLSLRVIDASAHFNYPDLINNVLVPYVERHSYNPQLREQVAILKEVTRSRYYKSKCHVKKLRPRPIPAPILRIYSCLRLYIVPDDGRSDGEDKLSVA